MTSQLELLCKKCTRQRMFDSADYDNFSMEEAVALAKSEGWRMDGDHFVCPKCD